MPATAEGVAAQRPVDLTGLPAHLHERNRGTFAGPLAGFLFNIPIPTFKYLDGVPDQDQWVFRIPFDLRLVALSWTCTAADQPTTGVYKLKINLTPDLTTPVELIAGATPPAAVDIDLNPDAGTIYFNGANDTGATVPEQDSPVAETGVYLKAITGTTERTLPFCNRGEFLVGGMSTTTGDTEITLMLTAFVSDHYLTSVSGGDAPDNDMVDTFRKYD